MRVIAIQFASLVVMAVMLAALISIGLMFVPPVQAASDPVDACEAGSTAEGETLYLCDVDGILCVWDPSPVMRSGVLDCEW